MIATTRPDSTVRPPFRYQTGVLRCANGENGIIIEKNHVSNEIAMLQEAFDMIVLEFENYLSQKLYLKSV